MKFTSTAFAIAAIAGASTAKYLESEKGRQLSSSEHSDLAEELFLMLDSNQSDSINVRWARQKCENWHNWPMSKQTAKTYREIINGTKSQFGCIRQGTGANKGCIVDYDSVLQYIVNENYVERSFPVGEWYKNPAGSLEGCELTCEANDGLNHDTCVATQGCQWEPENVQEAGVVYTVDCGQRNYADSVSFCENQGKQIATIHSEEDNQAITASINAESCDNFYIGAYRQDAQSDWTWYDGSAWDYQNPDQNQLNGYNGWHESRVVINKNSYWHDWQRGNANHGVVCQSYNGQCKSAVGNNTCDYDEDYDLEGCQVTCEANGGLDLDTCETTMGCQWDDGQCQSAVGNHECDWLDETMLEGCEVTCDAMDDSDPDTCETTMGCQFRNGYCQSAVGKNACDWLDETMFEGCAVTCEANGGLNFDTCETTMGCYWNAGQGQCFSAVGNNSCDYSDDSTPTVPEELFCSFDEAYNSRGPSRCNMDSECSGDRTCSQSYWCQGQSNCPA